MRKISEQLAVGLATFSFAVGVGAESAGAHAPKANRASAGAEVARLLKERLLNHEPVTYEANHDIIWGSAGLSPVSGHRTEVALEASVQGEKRYFELNQRGKTLRSIQVRELPEEVNKIPGLLTYDPLPGDVHHKAEIISTEGVISLRNSLPCVNVQFADGHYEKAVAGETTSYIQKDPIATI